MALVASTVALVLGLLISSAKSFYDKGNAEVAQLAADAVLIDPILVHYGAETHEIRTMLHSSIRELLDRTGTDSYKRRFDLNTHGQDALYDKLQALSPGNEYQKHLQAQVLGLALKIGHMRWLMFEQRAPFAHAIAVHAAVLANNAVCQFWAVCPSERVSGYEPRRFCVGAGGASFLIAEMYQPYKGLIRVPDAPMRAALAQMEQ
jgi:hypothetical protein